MSMDLDPELSASLQARADAGSPIDPEPLLAAAVARGQRVRTRRRAATAAAAVATLAALAATTALLPRQHADISLEPAPSATGPRNVNLARLPEAAGQPGAAARPDLVGTDPGILHFSVDALAAAAARVLWVSKPGVEIAEVQRTDFQVYLGLAQARSKLPPPALFFSGGPGVVLSAPVQTSLAGRAATVRTSDPWQDKGQPSRLYVFEWQPVNGLWARFEVQTIGGQQRALQILDQVRFDQTRRCVLPIRLDYLPPGATVPECDVDLSEDSPAGFSRGGLTVVDGQRRLSIRASGAWPGSGEYPRPLKAGPYQVAADSKGGFWTILAQGLFIEASTKTGKNSLTQAEVFRVLAGIRIADQVNNPGSW